MGFVGVAQGSASPRVFLVCCWWNLAEKQRILDGARLFGFHPVKVTSLAGSGGWADCTGWSFLDRCDYLRGKGRALWRDQSYHRADPALPCHCRDLPC